MTDVLCNPGTGIDLLCGEVEGDGEILQAAIGRLEFARGQLLGDASAGMSLIALVGAAGATAESARQDAEAEVRREPGMESASLSLSGSESAPVLSLSSGRGVARIPTPSPDPVRVAPTVTSISPASSYLSGAIVATIRGTHFEGVQAVSLCGVSVDIFTVIDATEIRVVVPPRGSAATGDVVVTTLGGTGTLAGAFTYAPAVSITSASPPSVSTLGGDVVTLTGSGFLGATGLTVDGAAVAFTITSDTAISFTAPAHAAGSVAVVVSVPGGSATLPGGLTYAVPAPVVSSISPGIGDVAGGDTITITGSNFTGATGVTIGGTAATSVTVVSGTSITCVTPAKSAGTYAVAVTGPGGTGTLAGAWRAFDYAAIAWGVDLDGVNRTSGSLITGRASAGTSGSNYYRTTSAGTIAAGATYNGRASWANTSDNMWSAGTPNNWNLDKIVAAGGTAFTGFFVVKIGAFPAVGTRFDNIYRIMGTQTSAYWGIGVYNDGTNNRVMAGFYDGNSSTYKNVSAIATTALCIVVFQFNGTTLRIKIGNGAWSNLTVTSGFVGSLANYLTNYNGSGQIASADICRISVAPSTLTDTVIADVLSYLSARYGASL